MKIRGGFDGRIKSSTAMKTATVASVTYLNANEIYHRSSGSVNDHHVIHDNELIQAHRILRTLHLC